MSREVLNLKELCSYLKLSEKEVLRRVSAVGLPGHKVSGAWRFRKMEVDDWLQRRMQDLSSERLAQLEHGVSREMEHPGARLLVTPLLKREAITLNLAARTKTSALSGLSNLADATGLVYDLGYLLRALREREALCPTAFEGGVATPHPRSRDPWVLAESFLVVALHPSGLPFGAPDGGLTHFFFMPLCVSDQEHLQVLARLCRMFQDRDFREDIREAETEEELVRLIQEKEAELVASWVRKR